MVLNGSQMAEIYGYVGIHTKHCVWTHYKHYTVHNDYTIKPYT